jgi:hypothetical protein
MAALDGDRPTIDTRILTSASTTSEASQAEELARPGGNTTDRPVNTELPPPAPPTAASPRRPTTGRKALVALVAVVVVVVIGGFFFARALYWALLQPTPDFASLVTTPDPSLTGTEAFVKPGDDRCVYVVAASGGEPEELACGDGLAGELARRDGGRVQSPIHPAADSDELHARRDLE